MPNLTIKPVAAAGNKVILQDQAGNTRLQTDDAGITITAPTIASMANCSFPAGHLIQSKEINVGSAYASGNIYRSNNTSNPPGVETHANFRMTCSNIPQVSNKVIKVQYNIHAVHSNHPSFWIVHSWDNSNWARSPRGAEDSAGMNWGDANARYPHSQGGYETDVNQVDSVILSSTWTDTTSSNTTLYVRLHWMSQNSTAHVFLNRSLDNNTTHGVVPNSSGTIHVYQG